MIPKRYKNVKPDGRAKEISGSRKSVLMIGPVGVGKTYKAAQIYNAAAGSREFFDAAGFLVEARRRKWLKTTDAAERYNEWIERAMSAGLLIIDDLGLEQNDEENAGIIRSIIQRRYNDMSMTVITTNLNGKQLEARYSARLISRVYEDYQVLIIRGKDRRRGKMSILEI